MILLDSGSMVAILNRRDKYHTLCVTAMKHLPRQPLITTWPCFTEAMYFLYEEVGYSGQQALWKLRRSGKIVMYELSEEEGNRMDTLMAKYSDAPMDLADASLVAVAESLHLTPVFTIDSHFRSYVLNDKTPFEIIS